MMGLMCTAIENPQCSHKAFCLRTNETHLFMSFEIKFSELSYLSAGHNIVLTLESI